MTDDQIKSDKGVTPIEVLECLRFLRTQLYAAQAQAVRGCDTILTRHVYDAYKRASDVCREIEINGISMAARADKREECAEVAPQGARRLTDDEIAFILATGEENKRLRAINAELAGALKDLRWSMK